MKNLHKNDRIVVRLTKPQRRDIDRAAKVVSEERRERVDPSTLVRELVMPRIAEILQKAEAA